MNINEDLITNSIKKHIDKVQNRYENVVFENLKRIQQLESEVGRLRSIVTPVLKCPHCNQKLGK